MPPDTSRWKRLGESVNATYYEVESRILACVPREGAIDDVAAAGANVELRHDYFRKGEPGVVIVFIDTFASQSNDAMKVYQRASDPKLLLGSAMVGGNVLSRAVMTFLIGLVKPKSPMKMFASVDPALRWARSRLQAGDRARLN